MGWLGWIILGIVGANVLLFGILAAVYLMEDKDRR